MGTDSELFLQNVAQIELRIIQEEQRQQRYLQKVKESCFDKYDTNQDGVLEKSELREYIRELCERTNMPMPDEVFFGMLFKSCDDNKNQKISFDEFIKHFGQHCVVSS